MKSECNSARFGTSLFRISDRAIVARRGLLIAALVFLSANTVSAHPGHDHHAPQSGIMHWLIAPTHALPILACLGLCIGFAIWKLRSTKRTTSAVEIARSKN